MEKHKKLILTSFGLSSVIGRKLIGEEIRKDSCVENKRIFLFHEPYYSIEPMLVKACLDMGFSKQNIVLSGQQKNNLELLNMNYIYVGDGNTFEIMALLRERGLDKIMQQAFEQGTIYIGASAGAIIAGNSIEGALLFDRNYIKLYDYEGLGLVNGIILPHCAKENMEKYTKDIASLKNAGKTLITVGNEEVQVLKW